MKLMRKKVKGFTSIELLTIMIIITILAIMIVPMFDRAREMARRTVCLGNLRMIGMALNMYAFGHNDKMPAENPITINILRLLEPYIGDEPNVFTCPSEGIEAAAGMYLIDTDTVSFAYAVYALPDESWTLEDLFGTPLMWDDDIDNHGGDGGNVLYLGGHVKWETAIPIPTYPNTFVE